MLKTITIIIAVMSIILISGCVSEQQPTCGNNIVENDEECDNSACPTIGQTCTENCKCETPSPPPLPT